MTQGLDGPKVTLNPQSRGGDWAGHHRGASVSPGKFVGVPEWSCGQAPQHLRITTGASQLRTQGWTLSCFSDLRTASDRCPCCSAGPKSLLKTNPFSPVLRLQRLGWDLRSPAVCVCGGGLLSQAHTPPARNPRALAAQSTLPSHRCTCSP